MDSTPVREFAERFPGHPPAFLVRAPGRVNLIGEHTDYNGLPVFPMALQRAVTIAVRPREDSLVRLANVDERFPPREFEIGPAIPAFPLGDWGNYAKAAVQELAIRFTVRRGFDGLVEGRVPDAAGLASSSALLVACALATLAANELEPDRIVLMNLCARAERYVGTQSGGMDQAICFGALPGNAALIEFDPLRLRQTPIPPDWRFVVANTFVEAKKSGAARTGYNARVRECPRRPRRAGSRGEELPRAPPAGPRRPGPRSRGRPPRDPLPPRPPRRHGGREGRGRAGGDARGRPRGTSAGRWTRRTRACGRITRSAPPSSTGSSASRGSTGRSAARLTGAGFGGCAVALCRRSHLEGVLDGIGRAFHGGRKDDAAAFVASASSGADVVPL